MINFAALEENINTALAQQKEMARQLRDLETTVATLATKADMETLEARQKDVTDTGKDVHSYLKASNEVLKVSKGAPAWRAYVEYINGILVNGIAGAQISWRLCVVVMGRSGSRRPSSSVADRTCCRRNIQYKGKKFQIALSIFKN